MRWIGVIHLPPLPGSPAFYDPMTSILARAIHEAELLASHGAWGVLIENYGDRPFFRQKVPDITIACMSVITHAVREHVNLHVGVNILRNAVCASLAVAAAADADFIRANVWSGTVLTDQGLVTGQAPRVTRRRTAWKAEKVRIMADIRVKYAHPLVTLSLEEELETLIHRARTDAVIITGPRSGVLPDIQTLKEVRDLTPSFKEIWLGSGARPENIEPCLPWIDGIIVGTYLRKDDNLDQPIDVLRLKRWQQALQ